jgi:hypothetical protein
MTPVEIRNSLNDLCRGIGPKATGSVYLHDSSSDARPVYASLHPYGGFKSEGYVAVYGTTFEEALDRLRAEWVKQSDLYREETTKKLALAIIRITAEHGACTDAALRQDFDAGVLKRWGADACALADDMAGRGPFAIQETTGANAPEIGEVA